MQHCSKGAEWLSLRQQVLFCYEKCNTAQRAPNSHHAPRQSFFAMQRKVQILFFISMISRTTVDVDDDDKNSSNDNNTNYTTITVT